MYSLNNSEKIIGHIGPYANTDTLGATARLIGTISQTTIKKHVNDMKFLMSFTCFFHSPPGSKPANAESKSHV